jgi:hypothetical protein
MMNVTELTFNRRFLNKSVSQREMLTSVWDILWYVALMLLLWLVVIFFAKYMTSVYQYFVNQPVIVDPFINGVKYPVSYWTEKGGRPYQEDRHHEIKGSGSPDSSLYGVFDGHGGHRAAQYCKDYLLKCIVADAEFEANPAKALFRSFFKYVYFFLNCYGVFLVFL